MEILEDQDKGLLSRFPEQQPLHGVQRLLAPRHGIERSPRDVLHRHVEQGQQCWQGRLQRAVEREELARHFLANLAMVVAILELEVALKKLNHRSEEHTSELQS